MNWEFLENKLGAHFSTSTLKSSFSIKWQVLQLRGWIVQYLKKTSSWFHFRGWKKGHSQNIYWPKAVMYFCLIVSWKHFTCSLFLLHEIWSHGCGHTSMKVSMARVPWYKDCTELSLIHSLALPGRGGLLLRPPVVQKLGSVECARCFCAFSQAFSFKGRTQVGSDQRKRHLLEWKPFLKPAPHDKCLLSFSQTSQLKALLGLTSHASLPHI